MSKTLNLKYIGITFFAVIFSWLIHEFFHWILNTVLGYNAAMTLNTVYLLEGSYKEEWHRILVSAAGPIITVVQAVIIYLYLFKKRWNKYLYPFLFIPFYTRALAGIISYFNPNDEARISSDLGIGTYTLPIIVSGFLFFLLYKITRQHKLAKKFQIFTLFLVMLFSSILILTDQFFKIRLL